MGHGDKGNLSGSFECSRLRLKTRHCGMRGEAVRFVTTRVLRLGAQNVAVAERARVEAVRFAHFTSVLACGSKLACRGENEGRTHKASSCSPGFESGAVAIFRLVSPLRSTLPVEIRGCRAGVSTSGCSRHFRSLMPGTLLVRSEQLYTAAAGLRTLDVASPMASNSLSERSERLALPATGRRR